MQTVESILATKGSIVHTIPPDAAVLQAVRKMNNLHLGCLLVADRQGVSGIITARDVLQHVVGEQLGPADVKVGRIMTHEVVCCRTDDTVHYAHTMMKMHNISYLPVVDTAGELAGLISIGDLQAELFREEDLTLQYLHDYIQKREYCQ